MKFINKKTGNVLEPQSKDVEAMMMNDKKYEIVKEKNAVPKMDLTKDSIKKKLSELGVSYSNSENKASLQEKLDKALKEKEQTQEAENLNPTQNNENDNQPENVNDNQNNSLENNSKESNNENNEKGDL